MKPLKLVGKAAAGAEVGGPRKKGVPGGPRRSRGVQGVQGWLGYYAAASRIVCRRFQ